jgi:hypothetical protein
MGRDRDTGPAAAQDQALKKVALIRLKLGGYSSAKRPQNLLPAGRDK